MATTCALQHVFNQCGGTICTNVGEKGFEAAADAGKVRFNRFGVDVSTLEGDVITEGLRCGVNRQLVEFAEGEV